MRTLGGNTQQELEARILSLHHQIMSEKCTITELEELRRKMNALKFRLSILEEKNF